MWNQVVGMLHPVVSQREGTKCFIVHPCTMRLFLVTVWSERISKWLPKLKSATICEKPTWASVLTCVNVICRRGLWLLWVQRGKRHDMSNYLRKVCRILKHHAKQNCKYFMLQCHSRQNPHSVQIRTRLVVLSWYIQLKNYKHDNASFVRMADLFAEYAYHVITKCMNLIDLILIFIVDSASFEDQWR